MCASFGEHSAVLASRRHSARSETSMSIAVETARVALLGCGTVGGAFAALSRTAPAGNHPLQITAALVRDTQRPRAVDLPPLTEDARLLLESEPDVLVELLGGTEPA